MIKEQKAKLEEKGVSKTLSKRIDDLTSGNRELKKPEEPTTTGVGTTTTAGPGETPETPKEKPEKAVKKKIAPVVKQEPKKQEPKKDEPQDTIITQDFEPITLRKPDELPGLQPVWQEIQILKGTGTGFAVTGDSDEPGDVGDGSSASTSASAKVSQPAEISALVELLREAQFPEPCYRFITSTEGLAHISAALTVTWAVSKSAVYTTTAVRAVLKGILSKFGKPGKIAAGIITATALGNVAIKASQNFESFSELLEQGWGSFTGVLVGAGLVPDPRKVGTDCVVITEAIIIALAAAVTWWLSTAALVRLGKGAVAGGRLTLKSTAQFTKYFATKLISILRSRGQETKQIVEEAVEEVVNNPNNRDALEELPQETIATIRAIPELAGRFGVTGEKLSTYVYGTIDPTDPRQKELANRLMDEVFTKIDNDYKLVSAKRGERALDMAKQAEKQYNDVVKQLRGQMDLGFGDVLTSENFSTTEKLMNSAFDEKSIDKAAELIDDIMKTAKSRGFIKGPLLDKKNLIEFAADAQKQATASGQPVTKLEILGYLMDRVSSDAKKLRIDIEDFNKFATQAAGEVGEQLTRSEAQKIIKDRVDETVRRLSKDLPDLDPQKAPEQIQKIKESAEKIGEEVYDDVVEQAKKSGAVITKGRLATVITMATAGALVAAYRAAKVPEPSKAPWYFGDDSMFSKVNGFMGREQYQKLDKKVLNSPRAKQELLRIIFNPNNKKTNTFIEKLANINPQKIPVDELMPYSKELLKDFSELHKDDVLDSLERKVPVQQLYGTDNFEVISQKKEVMYRIISELFLFNENFDGKLVEYLKDVVSQKEKYTKQNRIIDLKKIFTGPSARSVSMSSYNDKNSSVKKHTNPIFSVPLKLPKLRPIIPTTVSGVPVPRANKEAIEKIFGSFGEEGKDWNRVPGKREIKGPAVTEMWRNFEKISLPWGGETWFHKKIADQVKEIAEIANKSGYKPETFVGANPRTISTEPDSSISLHSYGITFDVDSEENARPKIKTRLTQTQAGRDFAKAWVDAGWDWGVHWSNPDTMHFERTNRGWTWPMYEEFFKEKGIELLDKPVAGAQTKIKEIKQMSKKDIRDLVAEVLNENYSKYHYNANEPSEGEPDEDYMVEWSALVDEVCGSKVKNVDGDPKTMEDAAVEVAKIFVKDQDLFRDVLEMAGSNKSIGVEILQQLKAAREKTLDKEKNV
jgi:hypothetical protein